MGATYANITLRGPSQAEVVQAVTEEGMAAVVSPTDRGVTVVYDCRGEEDPDVLAAATRWLSQRFGCAAWGVYAFDSDVVLYTLCRNGQVLDQYDSAPGYPDVRGGPSGGSAEVLCREMQLKPASPAAVEAVLRRSRQTFEERRHGDLMLELGHPDLAWATRFSDFWMDEPLPEGYAREQFRVVGGDGCDDAYSFEAGFRVPRVEAADGRGNNGGGGARKWWLLAAAAGAAGWLFRRRKDDGMSRRTFVALLAAGGLAAAAGVSAAAGECGMNASR